MHAVPVLAELGAFWKWSGCEFGLQTILGCRGTTSFDRTAVQIEGVYTLFGDNEHIGF